MMKKIYISLVSSLFPFYVMYGVSPYIETVYEFLPAPGQFVNVLPACSDGETEADILAKVQSNLAGKAPGTMISLGGFGGYVTFGFDHSIVNVRGKNDFKVYGNAFSGNSEPGVIMVSKDDNDNGLPDDEWYEIKGSAHDDAECIKDYKITYYKPESEPERNTEEWDNYIRWTAEWTDGDGNPQQSNGAIPKNIYHAQTWWPKWMDTEELVFTGTKLPDNGVNTSTSETKEYWVLSAFDYGYVDNHPNTSELSEINIEWAVDKDGKPANLEYIDFIRVYNGMNQVCGWIGETSTEVLGCEDLHPELSDAVNEVSRNDIYVQNPVKGTAIIVMPEDGYLTVFDMTGNKVVGCELYTGKQEVSVAQLQPSLYVFVIKTGGQSFAYKVAVRH